MFRSATFVALIALTTVAFLEGRRPKAVKVVQTFNDAAFYDVKNDGTVLINWAEVEAPAASK